MLFKPPSFHLQWHVTERCNLNCKHCYISPGSLKEELSTQELLSIFEKYLLQTRKWGISREENRISFTGGEPLLREDLFILLEECFKKRDLLRYGILTNGILLDRKVIRRLESLEVDYIQISLEGMRVKNDYIRGEGSFGKVAEILELLKGTKIPVIISMTVSQFNIGDVKKMIHFGMEMDVDSLIFRNLVPFGRGKKMEDFLLGPQEVKLLFSYIIKARKEFGMNISLGCEDGILAQRTYYSPEGCSAGYGSFTVLPNGDVYPCRRLPLFSGNLLEQSFSEIYYESEVFKELRNLNNINSTCRSCPFFHECHGGAKCINYAYFGDVFAPSPHCWRLFDKLPEKKYQEEKENRKSNEVRLDSKRVR